MQAPDPGTNLPEILLSDHSSRKQVIGKPHSSSLLGHELKQPQKVQIARRYSLLPKTKKDNSSVKSELDAGTMKESIIGTAERL